MGRIVVGVDGSDGSRRALATAASLARQLGWKIDAVISWQLYYGATELPTVPALSSEALETSAKETLDEAIESVDCQHVTITRHVLEGDPANVLLQQAADADMLVVGSRGRGGFTGLLLGSVSQKVVQHATCPVLVIPKDA